MPHAADNIWMKLILWGVKKNLIRPKTNNEPTLDTWNRPSERIKIVQHNNSINLRRRKEQLNDALDLLAIAVIGYVQKWIS